MNTRNVFPLFLATVFAVTSFATPVFASGVKAPAKQSKAKNTLNAFYYNPGNKNNFKFSDSKDVDWATKAIEKLGAEGIISGKNATQFKPKENVTELEALTMILNLTGNKTTATQYNNKTHPLYSGVKPTWGLGYLFLAIEKKILLPEELKGFNPNATVKRHEVAKYIVRALGETEEANDHMDEALDFKDANAVPKKSVGYVYVATQSNLMSANTNNEFQPMKAVTRAEMAVILDNTDIGTPAPGTGSVAKKITFVSYNASTDKITTKQNGKTYTYTVLDNAPVYIGSSYSSLDALKAGDILELVFNSSNKVIFIEVTNRANDNGNNDTDLGNKLSAESVSYNNLPTAIQDRVDSLKSGENYKAYRYNGYIYLIATRGEKNTGGYTINIGNVYRYQNDDNDYTLNVTVTTKNPSPSSIVTQVLTYPYDVARIKYFSGIDTVRFLDASNNILADTAVYQQDEEQQITGTVKSVDNSNRIIEIQLSNGKTSKYIISSSTPVTVNGSESTLSKIAKNMSITLGLDDSKVTYVEASDSSESLTGILTGISVSSQNTITVKIGSSYKSYTLTSNTKIYVNGNEEDINDLRINDEVTIKLVNGVLDEITVK